MGKTVRRFFCMQRYVVKRDALDSGTPKRRTLYRSGPRSRGLSRSCRASWSAALRSHPTAFSSSRMAFMSRLSTCFWAVSRSISRRHSFGVISSPLSFSSFRYRAAASYRISSRLWRCSNCSRFSGFTLASCLWMDLYWLYCS